MWFTDVLATATAFPSNPFWLQCDCHHTGLVQYFVAENDFTHWLLKVIKGCHWNKKSPKSEIR